ncbi:hypothetical protein TorRG33x02_185650 [Trema orientale]|uniref:Uncharacterized protein n=1 Tax=Trema orientale TaxID=63057 RepID=A0A2P5EJK9_TREOI|nr:hypothetical protein TorRG33x02_185650 [Trema orientale]
MFWVFSLSPKSLSSSLPSITCRPQSPAALRPLSSLFALAPPSSLRSLSLRPLSSFFALNHPLLTLSPALHYFVILKLVTLDCGLNLPNGESAAQFHVFSMKKKLKEVVLEAKPLPNQKVKAHFHFR